MRLVLAEKKYHFTAKNCIGGSTTTRRIATISQHLKVDGRCASCEVGSFGKRLLFAWTQADINILFTSYLKPESRIQIWRNVQERVSQIAPFLRLDADPYPVVSEGKQYWIQDAYTISDRFPYSNPHREGFGAGLNYIRNSVKVIVDMYDGTVSFYVMDPDDPVLAVYQRAFPGVFKDLRDLSPDRTTS